MPIFTTCLNLLPVIPSFSPRAHRGRRRATSFLRDSRTSAWIAAEPANSERSAVCSTARCSVLLIGSPRNIAAMRAGKSAARARSNSSGKRLLRDALAREIEQPVIVLDVKILPALRIAARQVAQMRAADLAACAATACHASREEFSCAIATPLTGVDGTSILLRSTARAIATLTTRLTAFQPAPHRFAAGGLVEQREHMLVRRQFLLVRPDHRDAHRVAEALRGVRARAAARRVRNPRSR